MANVFVVKNEYEADIKVLKVSYNFQADLLFYEVDQDYNATRDELWYFVKNEYDPSIKIFWVDYEYQADLKVFEVEYDHQAGWNRSHPLESKLD